MRCLIVQVSCDGMMIFSSAKAHYHYLPAILVIPCVDCRLDLQADLIMPAIKEPYLVPAHIHTTTMNTGAQKRCSAYLFVLTAIVWLMS